MASPDLSWMVGKRISNVTLTEPVSWWFEFEGGGRLRADSLWRIIWDGRVNVTSEDHNQQFGLRTPVDSSARAAELLSSKVVNAAFIRADTGDVILEFDTSRRLEVLTTSGGYESWQIFSPAGDETIGLGGGDVASWRRDV